ncbi:trans-sulfuration enzyme family protein [Rhodospirillum rubrum]|uniref:Cystathionine gamma-synthase n=1 Tax=Rhodospirillum rubrum (strain ATCC 11170 / ATH 1.1.1 / DSM 467 / LMG 4362 / NCIMB 8255 / S1) TaxID=269796 RepID=Q2RY92_RHORT|nr:aminotransferase class I/II-fold pyridoxal phosphate-dependent enzyme [Rhodospirillum rubrum]ABC20903.1 cystathionine gamma-synthase [Rhodospirillum rubrum ATCC 11170]AEO46570.1 cystathionine gamma-synthase [Rhodospirillum rubrum F11]MBK5952461.1 cystathionine gamma-synthase [Rhodospirillum rubrum]QXG80603.1 aminotransferase class I/II-fold pyridoxal phosphate-dependent enzyme [Rhodospirillum rubrum]HAP99966.1 cystathionine gamma-synthase [Rhodospirillum rubrum]
MKPGPFPPLAQATLALHAGTTDESDGAQVLNPLVPATSFFTKPEAVGFSANDMAEDTPFLYTRWNNPTNALLEERLAALEGGEAAVVFASGMAALSGLFLSQLKAGDHLVISSVCYAGLAEVAHDILPGLGIATTAVDTSNLEAVRAALRPETRLIHIETPGNPILRLSDIEALAAIAHAHGALLSVDSTMATPIATRPLALGADFVAHSLTKYACGHGDALGGAIIGKAQAMAALRKHALIHFGGAISPFAAWLILRGLETLSLRMAGHQAGAAAVAAYLEGHPRLRRVLWPGLPSHPQHALACRQMKNFSGMVSFSADDGPALARQLAERLQVISYAVSLGKTRSLLFYIPTEALIASSFHLDGDDARSYRDWTGDGTFRLSVGLEDPADLIADLERALAP